MNIYKIELKQNFKSHVAWAIAYIALLFLFLSMYPSIEKDVTDFMKLINAYPKGILDAFGVNVSTIFTFMGYYAFAFTYIILCGAIHGMVSGMTIVSKEGTRHTSDFLLTKPASRISILAQKYSAVVTSLVIVSLLTIGAAWFVSCVYTRNFDTKIFLKITFSLLWIQLLFSAMGFMIGTIAKKIKNPVPLCLGIVLFFFSLSMLGNALKIQAFKYISLLTYFDANQIIKSGSYEGTFILLSVILWAVFLGIGIVYYKRKNIQS